MSNFWDFIWLILSTFVFVAYLLILFQIVADLFRDSELGGGSKALWLIGLIFVPMFTALVYVIEATRNVDPLLIRAAQNLGANRWQVMKEVILPGSLPQILSGMKVILGLAWTCVISAELVAAREGLGFLIMNGKEFFQTEVVVLGMLLISITVLVTDFVFRVIENRVLRWQR